MLQPSAYVKLIVAVPETHAAIVREALGQAGAGQMGNYSHCSGPEKIVGRFIPLPGADPAIGSIGKLSEVLEERIETICREDLLPTVVAAIKKAHPYEEPVIDIVPRLELS